MLHRPREATTCTRARRQDAREREAVVSTAKACRRTTAMACRRTTAKAFLRTTAMACRRTTAVACRRTTALACRRTTAVACRRSGAGHERSAGLKAGYTAVGWSKDSKDKPGYRKYSGRLA